MHLYGTSVQIVASTWLQIDHKSEKKAITPQFSEMTSTPIFFDVAMFLLSCLVTGSGFLSISWLLLELWQFSFVKDWPEIWKLEIPYLSFDQYLEIEAIRDTKPTSCVKLLPHPFPPPPTRMVEHLKGWLQE